MTEEEQRHEIADDECPVCMCRLDAEEVRRGVAVCGPCDRRLDCELAAYLDFVKVCRSS